MGTAASHSGNPPAWLSQQGQCGPEGARSPGQIEAIVDDLCPVEDRDDLEGAAEGVTSGWDLGQGPGGGGDGAGGRQTPTDRFLCSWF